MSTINLLPDDYVQRRRRRRANILCLALFIVVMCGVVGAAVVSERSRQYTQQMLERVNADYEEAARLIEQMRTLEVQRYRMREKARMTASLVERTPRSTILAVITNARPKHTSLVKVELDTKRVFLRNKTSGKRSKFTTVSQRRAAMTAPMVVTMDILGKANTDVEVARFIANLARHPLIGSVDLAYSEELKEKDATYREFKIIVTLNNDVDALDAIRKTGFTTAGAERKIAHASRGDIR